MEASAGERQPRPSTPISGPTNMVATTTESAWVQRAAPLDGQHTVTEVAGGFVGHTVGCRCARWSAADQRFLDMSVGRAGAFSARRTGRRELLAVHDQHPVIATPRGRGLERLAGAVGDRHVVHLAIDRREPPAAPFRAA